MIIIEDGKEFKLEIIGHEFDNATDYHNSNWLKVKINVTDGDLKWSATDDCLLSYELVRLYDWLIHLPLGEEKIFFTENEIEFRFDKSKNSILVVFDFRFHPKGSQYEHGCDDEYVVSFDMDDRKLKALANDVKKWIEKYPVKNKRE